MKESLNLPHNADLEEIVVCAAIRFKNESDEWIVIPSIRHFDKNTHLLLDALGHSVADKRVYEQGFLTNKYRYVDREEALIIAKAQGQITRKFYNYKELFSENLY